MTPERFRALIEAYGADAQLWPAEERGAAADFAASLEGHALWSEAVELDRLLASHRVEQPASALYLRILENAPAPRAVWRRARLWWSGAALAGMTLAGGAAGALVVSLVAGSLTPPPSVLGAGYSTPIFSDLLVDGSGE
jgi:hypothetical protein